MKSMQTRTLVEASLLAALAAVIMVISVYIPVLSIIGMFAWPIPITILTFKYNIKTSFLSLAVSVGLAALVSNPVMALSIGLLYGFTAIVLGYCLRKRYSPFITIIAISIATFVSFIAYIKLTALLTGVDLINDFLKLFDEAMKQNIDMMKSMGITQQQIDQSPISLMNSDSIRKLLPGALAASSIFLAYVSYYIIEVIFKRLRLDINRMKHLDEWYIGNSLSFGLFFTTIASLLFVLLRVPNADVVSNSLNIIFQFVFAVDGLAVCSWFLSTRRITGGLRRFLVIIIFLMFSRILFFLGLIDYLMDFRKINPARRRRIPPRE